MPRVIDVILALTGDDELRLADNEPAEHLRKIPQEDDIDVEIDDFIERQGKSQKLAQTPTMAGIQRIESPCQRIQLGAVDIDDFDAEDLRCLARTRHIVVIGDEIEWDRRAGGPMAFEKRQKPVDDAVIGYDGNSVFFR